MVLIPPQVLLLLLAPLQPLPNPVQLPRAVLPITDLLVQALHVLLQQLPDRLPTATLPTTDLPVQHLHVLLQQLPDRLPAAVHLTADLPVLPHLLIDQVLQAVPTTVVQVLLRTQAVLTIVHPPAAEVAATLPAVHPAAPTADPHIAAIHPLIAVLLLVEVADNLKKIDN